MEIFKESAPRRAAAKRIMPRVALLGYVAGKPL
jgi:hypothetical protein